MKLFIVEVESGELDSLVAAFSERFKIEQSLENSLGKFLTEKLNMIVTQSNKPEEKSVKVIEPEVISKPTVDIKEQIKMDEYFETFLGSVRIIMCKMALEGTVMERFECIKYIANELRRTKSSKKNENFYTKASKAMWHLINNGEVNNVDGMVVVSEKLLEIYKKSSFYKK